MYGRFRFWNMGNIEFFVIKDQGRFARYHYHYFLLKTEVLYKFSLKIIRVILIYHLRYPTGGKQFFNTSG